MMAIGGKEYGRTIIITYDVLAQSKLLVEGWKFLLSLPISLIISNSYEISTTQGNQRVLKKAPG